MAQKSSRLFVAFITAPLRSAFAGSAAAHAALPAELCGIALSRLRLLYFQAKSIIIEVPIKALIIQRRIHGTSNIIGVTAEEYC